MSACPTCGKPVDALRARHVAVRAGKVTAYCSPECLAAAAGDASAPVRATPAQGVVKSGVALDSGPVIEIRYEPASGVVTSAPDNRPRTADALVEPKAEAKPDAKSDPKPDAKKERAKTEPPKPPPRSEPKLEPKKAGEPKPKRLEIIEQTGSAAPELPPGAEPGPAKKLSEEIKPLAGPRRPGRTTIKRDNASVEQAEDWIDDEPADETAVRAGTDLTAFEGKRGGRGVLITLLIVALLAGGVVLAIKLLDKSSGKKQQTNVGQIGSGSAPGSGSTPPDAGPGSSKRVVGPAIDTQKITPADRVARAIAILKQYLADKDSPRVQRVAAVALSRTGDKDAIDRLASALRTDKLEPAGQLDVAYALARAGDRRGETVLLAAVTAPRRDDKLAAGRYLIQLGHKRGIDTLAPYLQVPQHRVGAAELLARIAEPRGIKVLEEIRADKTANPDHKARAVIGLGFAGKPAVMDELRALLADNHHNVFAAEALATRRDESARPVLERQLELTAFRVRSARALRLLAPDRDATPYLDTLTAALDDPHQQRDTEQIALAEAILLLAGPAKWSERK